jgi:hypothetical protein
MGSVMLVRIPMMRTGVFQIVAQRAGIRSVLLTKVLTAIIVNLIVVLKRFQQRMIAHHRLSRFHNFQHHCILHG